MRNVDFLCDADERLRMESRGIADHNYWKGVPEYNLNWNKIWILLTKNVSEN